MILSRPYAITVPSAAESLTVLEGLCEEFLSENADLTEDQALALRLAVLEGCKNAIAQRAAAGRLNMVTVVFNQMHTLDPGEISLEICDPGAGFEVDGLRPSYPESLIGTRFRLASVLEHELIAEVLDRNEVAIHEQPLSRATSALGDRLALIEALDASRRGLGLLSLCRCFGEVRFSYDAQEGNWLRLSVPILGVAAPGA